MLEPESTFVSAGRALAEPVAPVVHDDPHHRYHRTFLGLWRARYRPLIRLCSLFS